MTTEQIYESWTYSPVLSLFTIHQCDQIHRWGILLVSTELIHDHSLFTSAEAIHEHWAYFCPHYLPSCRTLFTGFLCPAHPVLNFNSLAYRPTQLAWTWCDHGCHVSISERFQSGYDTWGGRFRRQFERWLEASVVVAWYDLWDQDLLWDKGRM